jgi:fumarylacetoacetate (FAA) hydrolase
MRLASFADEGGQAGVGRIEGDRLLVLAAPDMLRLLAGEGRDETGVELALADVRLLAPVPEPPSVRDFYAFEGHVAAGAARRGREIAPYWYEAPAFYFSNPASIHGPGEPLRRPASTSMLDFELEIAAVIGADDRGELGLFGFTLMNDWSARDVQASEVTVGLGPAKAKDFGISLGPWLVTPDELPYRDGRLHVSAKVEVNGEQVAAGDASHKHFTWPDLIAHAARDTRLRPGDVIGSGTITGGSLWELETDRWIEPGDTVALEAEALGRLETPVVQS